MKKVFKTIKRVILWILAIAFFAFAIAMTILVWNINKFGVSQVNDYSMILLKNKITSDIYAKGDIIIVEKKPIEELEDGMEVFAYQVNAEKVVTVDIGKIGHIHGDENAISFVNGSTYDMDFVAGQAIKRIEKWGYVLSIIMSKWGFLFIVLVPCFIIFIYEVYALIIEIKYGRDDEFEDDDSKDKLEKGANVEEPKPTLEEINKDKVDETNGSNQENEAQGVEIKVENEVTQNKENPETASNDNAAKIEVEVTPTVEEVIEKQNSNDSQ